MKKIKSSKLVDKIVELHIKYFIPEQYSSIEEHNYIPCVRIVSGGTYIQADVVVLTSEGHDFMDGNLYHNGDGVGVGRTLKKALVKLLSKTEKSIKLESWK